MLGDKLNTKKLLVVIECLKDRTFKERMQIADVRSSLCLSRGQLWNIDNCRARINYLKPSCLLHYPLTVWSHNFTGCSQGGEVTFGNTLCTFKISPTGGMDFTQRYRSLSAGGPCIDHGCSFILHAKSSSTIVNVGRHLDRSWLGTGLAPTEGQIDNNQ